MTCWSCGQQAGEDATCAACGRLQPPRARDHFEVLGVPRAFHLELPAVESRFRELSKKLHPDKFAKADAKERRLSLEHTTRLNQAWKALKDPLVRAEYLLKSEGFEVAGEEGSKVGRKLPLEFYEEVIEDREALVEAKASSPEAVRGLGAKVTARRDRALAVVDRAFLGWEASGDRTVLEAAALELAKLRYYARFLDEVEGRPHE
jgi:molecular chaperone HscB